MGYDRQRLSTRTRRVGTVPRRHDSRPSEAPTAEATRQVGAAVFAGGAGTLAAMGLNPFREQRKTAFDVAMVVGAVVVTIGIVLWAMFGG